jgi:quinol-cytochrome oxidoreductase complex cytochrome b subunit
MVHLQFFFYAILIITGIMLTFYYVPDTEKAFESVRYLMREVNHD